ncbi:unnamed protein product [Agarophyton chilense]|eukprot:gb/GEZJ01003940.1/.p1 GENE.gb/GEZJ01003940.1/~~gb/GEZJ01003940.1/.p1  ORF type:complete len:300 (+),score=48.20 gb/GEZJ01003940.1/:181-1080(+)
MTSSLGLPIENFLSSLDWLSNSHSSSPSAQNATNSCNACTSLSANCCVADSDLHQSIITGVARFHLACHQQLCFAPVSNETDVLSDISAVIGMEQDNIRIVLRTCESAGNLCLTIDETKMIKPVRTSQQQHMHMIHFTFPSVILVFQSRTAVSADSSEASTANAREQKKLDSLKEAVNKLREKDGTSATEQLSEQNQSLEDKEGVDLEQVFTDVLSKGAKMVMPPCFPYVTGAGGGEDAGNSSASHIAFVQACMRQETAISDALKQTEGWVHFARRKRMSVEHSPTKNGTKARRTSELL